MIDVSKLKEEAQRDYLKTILENLITEEPDLLAEDVEYLLDHLIQALDVLSEDDGFGTEGWEHRFGIEL